MKLTAAGLEAQLRNLRELENRLTFQMAVLSRRLDQKGADLLRDQPVNLTGYRILTIVEIWSAISISDLSRVCGIDRGQISRAAEALGKQGFVRFGEDPGSRRKKLVLLTDEGQAKLDEVKPRFLDRNRKLEAALGLDGVQALQTGLRKLAEALAD